VDPPYAAWDGPRLTLPASCRLGGPSPPRRRVFLAWRPSCRVVGQVPAASLVLAILLAAPAVVAQPAVLELHALRVGTEYQLGPQDTEGHQPGAWGSGAPGNVYANSGREWVFAGTQAYQSLRLDKSKTIEAHVVIGGGVGEAGQHDIGWELKAGETLLATGEPKEVQFTGNLVDLSWSVAPVAEAVPAGSTLTFRVHSTGVGIGLRVNLQDTAPGWTRIALPVIGSVQGAERAVHHRVVQGSALDLNASFAAPETSTIHYNWTTEATSGTLVLDATVSAGSLSVTVADGAGKALLARNLTASGSFEQEVEGAAAGTWRITFNHTGFTGSVALALEPPETPGVETTTSSSDTATTGEGTTDGTTTSATSSTTGSGTSNGTPVPLAVALAAIALALLARRRR
jgi:MYXO-CTERM domain-containing protein